MSFANEIASWYGQFGPALFVGAVWGLVFAGTGLLIGAFIPFVTGDSLIFAAGIVAANNPEVINIWVLAVGIGIFASKGVLVNAFSKIGNFTILNTGCIIEHECEIGSASHIAPGAVLAGNVKIGERVFIGANSVIRQGVEVGDDVIIGAGSVIINNISSNTKIAGNPGRII